MDTALLIIDAQMNMFEVEPVFRANEMLATLESLILRARQADAPVIFIRHNGRPHGPSQPGTPGWDIHPRLAPRAGETIIDKHTPDAFYQTDLAGILDGMAIRRLVLAGMLTEYCIDTNCRRAWSMDYAVTLVADAHSTISGDYENAPSAEQVIAHYNATLRAFADVVPAADIRFDGATLPDYELDALTAADRRAIHNGLGEWQAYETWLATGESRPFWPHSHPMRIVDTFHHMWDPSFTPRGRYVDPPRWEMGLARAFMKPLENIPPAFRKANLQAVKGAIDHLLQNPRNPLSTQMRPLDEKVWLYESRDLRLFYIPHVTTDKDGRQRHYVFLIWLAPGVPVHNPFA